ncbi:uncharacterized protein [Panulirus ornatus]|uniref:uncharacterized protein isoform X2 n=1 Tax=Panulirus ornatus TaxID=150431 RepID=UPI003A89E60B
MSHLESGSVVWVRLGQAWWPGTITTVAKCPPEFVEGIRKIPIAIVKFFHENEFQDVHKAEHICPYNCDRKEEFIRRGQYTNKNQSHGEVDLLAKFEADVVTAEKLTGGDMNILQTLDACSPSYNIQSSPTNPRLELDYTLMSHKLVASSDSLCSTCVANDDYLPRPQRNLWPEIGEGVTEGHEAHTQGDSDSYKVRNPHSNDKDQSNYQTTHDQITSQLNEQNMAFFNDHILGATDVEVNELQFKNSHSDSQLQVPTGDCQCCFVDSQSDSIVEYVIQKNYGKENEEKDHDLKQCIFDEKSNVDMHVTEKNLVQFNTVKDHSVNILDNKEKQKQTLRYSDKMNIIDSALECVQIQHIDKQACQLHNDENFRTEAHGQELCPTSEVKKVKTLDEGDSGREVKDQKQIHTAKEINMGFMVIKQQNSHCDKPLQVQLGNSNPQFDDHLRCKKYMEEKFPNSVHVLKHPTRNTEVLRHSHNISEQNCHQTQKQYGLLHEQQGSATLEQQSNISQENLQSQTQKLFFTSTAIQPEKCEKEQYGTMYVANVEINMLTGTDDSKYIVKDLHNGQLTHHYPAGIDHNEHLPDATDSILSDETSHFVEVHSELMIENSSTTASLIPRQSTGTNDLDRIPTDLITYSLNEDTSTLYTKSSHSNCTLVNAPSVSVTSTKETNSTNADGDATDFEGFEAEKNENIYALTKILVDIINNRKRLYKKKSGMKRNRQKRTKSSGSGGKFGRNKQIKVKKGKAGRTNTNVPVAKSERKKTKGAKRKLRGKNSNCSVNDDSVVESKPSFIEKKNDPRLVKNIKNTHSTLKMGHAKVKRNFKRQLDSKNLPDNYTKKNTSNDRQTNIKTRSSRKVMTDSKQSESSRHPARKRKSTEMASVLKRETKIIRKELSPHELDISREKKQKKQVKVRKPGLHPKKKVTSRRGKNKNRNLDIRGGSTKEKEEESHSKEEYFGLSDRLEMEDDLPDLTVAPLIKGKLGSRFKTGDLVWSLYRGKWWPSFIQKICPVTKKALVYFIGCKEGSGIRVDIKNMKTFRCGEMPSGVNQSENGFTEALQLTESYCQLRDHGKSISVQEFFSMPPEEQDALIIVTLTPKEDPAISNQSMKRKLDEDMNEERTPESQRNWYCEPVRASGYRESSPNSTEELMLSARDRMKIQSAMKARRKENEKLLRFMKSASCMDHLWQIFNGEKSCERHKMYQDEVTRRTLLWSGIGPFQLDQDDDQILSVIDFLSTELSRKRPHFRLAHDYIFRVWMPEAIKEAMRVIKKVPEDELELALDEGYRETKSEKRARRLDFT